MEYFKSITLKDGRTCILRNGTPQDAQAALDNFILTHEQTDFLGSYPDERIFDLKKEEEYLQTKAENPDDAEIIALVDGVVVGTAGYDRIAPREKVRHRADFGISVDEAYWGLGVGRGLLRACIECARRAGYVQLELDVVAENKRARALYESEGFVEFGRNPKGLRSRITGWQETVLMRLEL